MRQNFGGTPVLVYPLDGTDVAVTNLIAASNLQFARSEGTSFGLAAGAAPVTGEYELFVANNTGTLTGFHPKVTVPGTGSVTVDLKKNGSSVLSAPVTLNSGTTPGLPQNATISVPGFVAGDRFTALLTVSASTGMSGVSATANAVENGQPL